MPNSYVNDNGEPNLNNSNAENDNDARVSVRIEGSLPDTPAPAADLPPGFGELGVEFQDIGFINQFHLQNNSEL